MEGLWALKGKSLGLDFLGLRTKRKKKTIYSLYKAPTFVGSGRGHGRWPYLQFIEEADCRSRTCDRFLFFIFLL